MPCAQLSRIRCSTSSAERKRDLRPRALIGAASARIEACAEPQRSRHMLLWQERNGRTLQPRQVFDEIILRSEATVRGIAQDHLEPVLGLSSEYRDAKFPAGIEPDGVTVQHGEAAGYVKSPDCDRYASSPEGASDIQRARVLVGLNSD